MINYDPERAADILDELGFKDKDGDGIRETPDGKPLTVEILTDALPSPRYTVTEEYCKELRKLGIDAKPLVSPIAGELLEYGRFDITLQGPRGAARNGDPYFLLREFHSAYLPEKLGERKTGGTWTWAWLKSPELDALIDKLGTMNADDPAAIPVYKEATRLFMKLVPFIPVLNTPVDMLYSTKYWTGWPSTENLYMIGGPWWPEFLLVYYKLKPVKAPPPMEYVVVWFTSKVAEFIGADGVKYGPFEEGEYKSLPKPDAERLVKEGLASYKMPTPPELSAIVEDLAKIKEEVGALSTTITETSKALTEDLRTLGGQLSMLTTAAAVEGFAILVLAVGLAILIRKKPS